MGLQGEVTAGYLLTLLKHLLTSTELFSQLGQGLDIFSPFLCQKTSFKVLLTALRNPCNVSLLIMPL